ncbi:lantibiotic dehydratase [Streptosporangium sp. NPDC002524]|uniref:lantibiotic dehydratase n=1 Tax=Streptosporangium sp. NPDC002524 TaxID=3154537 RepID=UPI0033347A71
MTSLSKLLYRHDGVALLRAAAVALSRTPVWPDPSNTEACRAWLHQVWSQPGLTDVIRQASHPLTAYVDAMRAGRPVQAKHVRRAAYATARYLLRASGRPTPFGLFAGVAHVSLGSTATVRWGEEHRSAIRVDAQWLGDIVERLEACPELLERLDVVFNNLATRRGGERLEVPCGPNRATIRYGGEIEAIRNASASPIRFADLVATLTQTFPGADQALVRVVLTTLVQQGFVLTCLRAPLTVTDPLAWVIDRLHKVTAAATPIAPLLGDLEFIQAQVRDHNESTPTEQRQTYETLTHRMRELSPAGRTPLAVDLRLDCAVQLPRRVIGEMERAASALLRLTRQPEGEATWRSFHAAFLDRYGTGALVPLTEVVNPDAGLGYPAGYPGSVLPVPVSGSSERDEQLLALAWRAAVTSSSEIILTEQDIHDLSDDRFDERFIPPHVELAARVHADSIQALERGDFTLTISPARSAGTLTSRFTLAAAGSGLERVYRAVPTATVGALPAQLSFPLYPHAENICRVPPYLPDVLSLGEHRGPGEAAIALEDLAVIATHDRLHLVSLSRKQVIEPQVFSALALNKQPAPLARFLAHLPRAFGAAWTEFDWGPCAYRLPYLPRVRYGRTVLHPARWRLSADDLPLGKSGHDEEVRRALQEWRVRWHCPPTVELREDDRSLRLNLEEPFHIHLLRAHLKRRGDAVLVEAVAASRFGWFGGHVHEIAVPLVATHPGAPSPLRGPLVQVRNHDGQAPGSTSAAWLYVKIHTHPERHDELIATHLPELLASLGDEPLYWFVRYQSPHETAHLRLRLRTPNGERQSAYAAAVGDWAQRLRDIEVAGRLVFDTYFPEVGRYGHGTVMEAAEVVFAADSHLVAAQLRHLTVTPTALAAMNMVDIVHGFLGDPCATTQWFTVRPARAETSAERAVVDEAVNLVVRSTLPDWPHEVIAAWQARAAALNIYREQLPVEADTGAVLESLLHMHHNRALGVDREGERTCRRLARQAALAWRVREGHGR